MDYREERAARARGVPDAAELTARVAVVVGLVRPVALETLPATGTWGAVASALDCSEARAQADFASVSARCCSISPARVDLPLHGAPV
eukprot:COSAG01_NODE_52598_length_345_cov_1.467480_1_plen_87_part_10